MITVTAKDDKAQVVAWQAYDLLWEEQGLRGTTADIEIQAEDGVLRLNGRVRTNTLRELARRLASAAADGWQINDNLMSDEEIALAIAARIGMDPRTTDANIRFEVFLGVAYLKGTVRNQAQQDAAVAIAGQTPGVVRVEDHLVIVR